MDWGCDAMLILCVHIGGVAPDKLRVYQTQLDEEASYYILDTVDNKTVKRIAVSDFLFSDESGAHILH